MDFGLDPVVGQAVRELIDRSVVGYVPAWLVDQMQVATAEYCSRAYGWDVAAQRVGILPDVLTGMSVAIEHFSRPGSPVIVPTPCYTPFMHLPGQHGRALLQVPMLRHEASWVIDEQALDAAFEAGGQLMILCNPHNPIGKVYTREELESICAVVERHGGRVFADEIHAPLVYPGLQHVPYAQVNDTAASHTVTAMAASKAWNLPGLKCAQLVLTNEADHRRYSELSIEIGMRAANPGLAASIAAYRDGQPWLGNVLDYLAGNQALLLETAGRQLPGAQIVPGQGTYLAWIDCRKLAIGDDPRGFFLREAGVALTDGALCGDAGRGFVRLNYATPRPILQEILDRMAAALN
jgi:cystathionine beta-lyase